MVDHRIGPAGVQRHVQRADHQISRHPLAHRPARHLTTEGIDHDGQVEEAAPGGDVGHACDPQLVGRLGAKPPIHQIRRWPLLGVALGGHSEPAPAADTADMRLAHQARHALATDHMASLPKFGADAPHAEGSIRGLVGLPDDLGQLCIGHRARTRRSAQPVVVAAA